MNQIKRIISSIIEFQENPRQSLCNLAPSPGGSKHCTFYTKDIWLKKVHMHLLVSVETHEDKLIIFS